MAMMVYLVALIPVLLVSGCSDDADMPDDCSDIYKSGQTVSGVYSIYPAGNTPVWVYCEMVSDGKDEDKGQWTVKMKTIKVELVELKTSKTADKAGDHHGNVDRAEGQKSRSGQTGTHQGGTGQLEE
ncbi:hypothetical protein QQF64_000380 [Cirrhinus molitorella]|uniref:Fibrinogen C-terminal domain-containing protein n=1 Tax=Cirrhinus molitorella TaxID=172907 RepID=A0ABR3NXN8_9TELE